ncbi:MAG: T9SS type A sorting domain-containing protein [Bacteroidetes bacterium]|nr:T9SS type A sorting domain-containing protein [Bacteroidota bacterium]
MYNKIKALFFLIVVSLSARIVLAQCTDTRAYITTPRGTDVPDTYQTCEFDQAWWWRPYYDSVYAANYPNAIQIKLPGEQYSSTRTFNCHGYAWSYVETGQRLWIGYSQAGSEEIFWNDGSYDQVSQAVCTKISYTGDHSAVPSGTANYYYSKWNAFPLMYHYKDYTPGYGTANQFFRRSVDVPQDQSSINSAVSAAVSGQTVNVSSGSYTLSGNISIPTGVTLTLLSGANVNFNGYYIDATNGTFNIQNGSTVYAKNGAQYYGLYTSIQPAINDASSSRTIYLFAPSYNESPTFSSKSNITLNGQGQQNITLSGSVSITNCSGIVVSNLTLSSLSLNNNTSSNISNVTATSASLATVYGGTGNEFYSDNASNLGASFGITSYGGTGDVASGTSLSNADCAVYLSNSASYNVGTNDYFCSNGYDISAVNGAYAYAINNTYSRINPVSVSGNVFVTGNVWACGGISSPAKGAKTTSSIRIEDGVSQQPDPLQAADSAYLALLRQINADKAANKYDPNNYTQSYNNLLAGYKGFVNNGNDKGVVKAALSKISDLYKAMGDNADFIAYITQALATGNFNSIQPYFKRYLIWNYVDSNQYNDAIKTADQILASSSAGDDLKGEMLYEEGLIYKCYLGDSTKANGMFASLSNNYPSSLLVRFADAEKTVSASSSDESDRHSTVSNEQAAETGLSNYPNPFNPTTTVSYKLPTSGFVTLKVYDALGREVATLVNGNQDAGVHSTVFDGTGLASGVYFYRLTAPGVSQTKKMLLTK